MVRKLLDKLLAYPGTLDLDLDDPRITELRRRIIREKKFLYQIYSDWYRILIDFIPEGKQPVLEIGSGAGFLDKLFPGVLTSEIFPCIGMDLVLDGTKLPFKADSLRGMVMVDVLHHIPEPEALLQEAARCVQPRGALVMSEPWVTPWSRFVYRNFHHEPFHPDRMEWEIDPGGPLSGANGALPWMIFERDADRFQRQHPEWEIVEIIPHTPIRYLLSGGVSKRSLVPTWGGPAVSWLERLMDPWRDQLAMFAFLHLVRRS